MSQPPIQPVILHATTVALRQGGRWRGVMLRGPSGVGKSELAWRARSAGWRLVADDRTLVWRSGPALYAKAPPRLSGLIEARGQGVLAVESLPLVRLALAVDLAAAPDTLERTPAPQTTGVLGVTLPCLGLYGGDGSALARLASVLCGQRRGAMTEPTLGVSSGPARADPSGAAEGQA